MMGVAAAVVTAIMIGALYFGREVFVPIALAILLSFVLAPLVGFLQRWHIPRALSVISVVLLRVHQHLRARWRDCDPGGRARRRSAPL